MKYEDFLDENIFEPLGMKSSGHDTFVTILEHRASGYVMNDGVMDVGKDLVAILFREDYELSTGVDDD